MRFLSLGDKGTAAKPARVKISVSCNEPDHICGGARLA
jgi:hypothetical protein